MDKLCGSQQKQSLGQTFHMLSFSQGQDGPFPIWRYAVSPVSKGRVASSTCSLIEYSMALNCTSAEHRN